ncbi:FAD-binding oxidoreductase [Sphaerimonospora thailandensis]|uniref:4-cresol dehydrogenase n=1 Tax=Sphaerimonospora thailandensis TaxID=795644 RepID=A0A8J3RDX2_9ACTN|nr:FAD-binding protein [Sphaerimonospora thailandensis]GIH72486.1 4-cresol dehydrogenase [Sphaerimonospora thailandensis]
MSDLEQSLQAAAEVVGADRVVTPSGPDELTLGPNVSVFPSRSVAGIIRPRTADEVCRVVEIFGRSPEAGSLHPYSTGRNWGLGTREPVMPGAIALDLGDLDAVRAIDVEAGWAVIEPGVTQLQLADLLDGTERMLNVTVSAARTSVIGNALDRGVGLRHQRVHDLVGLELACADGTMRRVGWWPDPEVATPVYPYGLGPSALQLFVQSDLAVVTAATVRLLPRPEALRVIRLNFVPEQLAAATDVLHRWVGQGLLHGVLKVYNPAAARGYGTLHPDHFLVHACVDGTAAAVEALTGVVVEEARRSGVFSAVSATDATDEGPGREVATLVERSYAGDPDRNDTIFEMKLGRPADQIDEHVGFLFFLPLVPFRGAAVVHADRLLNEVGEATGVRFGATLHALNSDVVDLVVSMKYERKDAAAPHKALDLLYESFTAAGFRPYRLDVDHTDWFERLGADRELLSRFKTLLDPHQAIAPGRYSVTTTPPRKGVRS